MKQTVELLRWYAGAASLLLRCLLCSVAGCSGDEAARARSPQDTALINPSLSRSRRQVRIERTSRKRF